MILLYLELKFDYITWTIVINYIAEWQIDTLVGHAGLMSDGRLSFIHLYGILNELLL